MSTPEFSAPLDDLAALMRRFISGEIEMDMVVQAFRALPSGVSGDFAFALDEGETKTSQARLDALMAALAALGE